MNLTKIERKRMLATQRATVVSAVAVMSYLIDGSTERSALKSYIGDR